MRTHLPTRLLTRRALLAAALAATVGAIEAAPGGTDGPLHVPSPDWRDQVVYFVMTDRFDDGEPANNDQGAGEYDPADNARYSGGDLRGIERRIGYIQGLGATALWITPPVANQWWSERSHYGGYHGYWARDLMHLDAHVGTLEDYRRLSRRLHGAGMYLVQDVVVNHMGNYFTYEGGWSADDPSAHFRLNADADGRTAPVQSPFDRNDPRDARQRTQGIYHWTPTITDYNDHQQLMNYQLADLDDLNTENPQVRQALRRSYGHWIREVGVDAFRVDTAFYVPPAYFDDFLRAPDPAAPGIERVAAATGREGFHVFGEGFGIDRPYDDAQMRRIDAYMRDPQGRALMPGMINFPLYGSSSDVFARGRPTAELAYRIERTMAVHREPHLMPTFVDNHDVDRFLSYGDEPGLKQALLAMLTLPGIPVIYAGTEQGLREQRASMFAAGYGSGGRDHFDAQSPLYRYLHDAIALRRGHRVFSRGVPTVLRSSRTGPGALVYRMDAQGEGERQSAAWVLFNTADAATLVDRLDTGLPPGTVLRSVFAIDGAAHEAVVDAHGQVELALPARAGVVLQATGARRAVVPVAESIAFDGAGARSERGDFDLSGRATGVREFRLVVDGDLTNARVVTPARDGRWRARIDTAAMLDPNVEHRIVAWDGTQSSAPLNVRVQREWALLAQRDDPSGDDSGPAGRYRYPTDPGWSRARPADLRGVRVYGSGGALKIELRMPSISQAWNPPNAFDHVGFNLFVQLPGRDGGLAAMPLQNATLPEGMRWHYRLRAHGWSNALFASEGASATNEGRPVAPAANISVDRDAHTVSFVIPAASLGRPASLRGAKVYIATWDYDGRYRPLTPAGGEAIFGGGDGARDPLVMDDSSVLTLR